MGAIYPASEAGNMLAVQPMPGYDAVVANSPSPQFTQILHDTNDYLQANKGAAADFNTLRDISEREANLLDEEIQAQSFYTVVSGAAGHVRGRNPGADCAGQSIWAGYGQF
ncbi:MAG: hypothetical protein WKG07_23275 [Hymenobacter sp.]